MNTHFFDRYSPHLSRLLYLLIWFLGILAGVIAAANRKLLSAGIIVGALAKSPSIIFFVLLNITKFLIFSFSLRFCKPVIIWTLLFVDAFGLGFCGIAIYIAAGQSVWLLRPLLLFSGVMRFVPVWLMLLRGTPCSRRILFCVIGFYGLIALIDYSLIAPVLSELAKYF